jgi:hypothetical protein
MPGARGTRMLGRMDHVTVHVQLQLSVEDDEFSGRVCAEGGQPRPFSGWIGLVSALDGLIAETTAHAPSPQPARSES